MSEDTKGISPHVQKYRGAELRVKVTELRKAGYSYRAIADNLGIGVTTAKRHVDQALDTLARQTAENADQIRAFELMRLDDLLRALWMNKRDPRYVDSILRVMDRRAKLIGLDAPTKLESKLETDVPLTPQERAAAIEQILAAAQKRVDEAKAGTEETSPAPEPDTDGSGE